MDASSRGNNDTNEKVSNMIYTSNNLVQTQTQALIASNPQHQNPLLLANQTKTTISLTNITSCNLLRTYF